MTSNKDISTVYIDESGDLGINKGTQWFIISGAIISKEDENNCLKTFRSIQNQLNIKKIHLREIRANVATLDPPRRVRVVPARRVNGTAATASWYRPLEKHMRGVSVLTASQ